MSKKNERHQLWIGLGLVLIAVVLIAVALISMMSGKATGDLTINGEVKVSGLVCKDNDSVHPAFTTVAMVSHTGTITANFRDDKLSSISLVYEGEYGTEQEAKTAKNFVGTEYGLILANKYGEKGDIFSSNSSAEGAKVQLVQTARDINKINSNTVTYFLLDQGTIIARTLDRLKKQYEAKGFTCEISE